ncbi:MAG: class I tRNA ligase family protein, partial [Deinococcus sp.]|nr:class I tRNA ligase family protein [Deinococcus sp.]
MASRLNCAIGEITADYEGFDLGQATRKVYHLVWSEFCDWYLEAAKPALREGNTATMENLESTLIALLKLLHPIMPFITSELYRGLTGDEKQLALQAWPKPGARDLEAERTFGVVQDAVSATRALRTELALPPQQEIAVELDGQGAKTVMENAGFFSFLSHARPTLGKPEKALAQVTPNVTVYLQPEGDLQAWKERQKKRLAELDKLIETTERKLANAGFVDKAPAEVVEAERERLLDSKAQAGRIRDNLTRFE